jgi:type IV pilus assembly protein PilC
MKRYIYVARDKQGRKVTGQVEASNPQVAARLVREKGMVVVTIKPARSNLAFLFSKARARITKGDIATFTRQLATMINAGLPITEALSILRLQAKPSLRPVVSQILADVEGGKSLSGSMKPHKVFSPTYIALIKAGETGGVLDKVLVRLADNLEKEQEFRSKVKGALIYPAIIVVGMIIVTTLMMIFVIPRLTALYEEFEAELPLATQILIGMSTFMVRFWWLLALIIGLAVWALVQYRKTNQGRIKTDELILKIPIFGELQRQIILTELTRTLALMVGSGVSILEGLSITAEVTSNVLISDALRNAAEQVEKGFPVAFSFARHPEAFPYILSQMIAVGEETGKMDEVLAKVSRVFEVESAQKVKTLTSTIEPVVMIFLGLGVGFLVISIILPIYNLTSQF